MQSDPLFLPYLGSLHLCDSYDANHCLNFSAIIEPVIWAGLGEGSLISEDLFWGGLLSHTLGKLVLAVSGASLLLTWISSCTGVHGLSYDMTEGS